MQRPKAINVTTALMAASLFANYVFSYTTWHLHPQAIHPVGPMSAEAFVHIVYAVSIVFSLFAAVCLFFYWKGQEWARWLVIIDSVFQVIGLVGLARTWHLSHFKFAMDIANAALALFLLWYLNQAQTRFWFRLPESAKHSSEVGDRIVT